MRKFFAIKSFSIATHKWSYLKRATADEIVFDEDVRWANFFLSERDALKAMEALPQGNENYYSIEEVYHKF